MVGFYTVEYTAKLKIESKFIFVHYITQELSTYYFIVTTAIACFQGAWNMMACYGMQLDNLQNVADYGK